VISQAIRFELPPERFIMGANIMADNMAAVSILGLAGDLKRKCPNATDTHIAAKIDWLEKVDSAMMHHS
jgi:hypothetical protein